MQTRTRIQCPRCGTQFDAAVQSLIDPALDPEAKVRLLAGSHNAAQCPKCGTVSMVATPIVYHDSQKEMLITFIPVELGLTKDRQEKVVGDMIREVTNNLPQEGRKGYLFRPRSALTMQGLVEQVLEADGITREMVEAQRAKMALVESLIQTPEEDLSSAIQQHDARIDAEFLQMMTMMAQRVLQSGRPDIAQQIMEMQQRVVEESTFGQELIRQNEVREQIVRDVAEDIRAMGEQAQRSDFLNLAVQYGTDGEKLQALVGLVRPALDQQFFQELTMRISQAPADEREQLEDVRDQLSQLVMVIDQQSQMAVQAAAELMQALMRSQNPDEMIRANLQLIDDTFMAVLSANIQEAERQGNVPASSRLKDLYNRVVAALRDGMQPELRFINELLSTDSHEAARTLLAEHAPQYGPALLEMMDAVGQVLASRGDTQILQRLAVLRQEAAQMLG
jgi:hypothetical protein